MSQPREDPVPIGADENVVLVLRAAKAETTAPDRQAHAGFDDLVAPRADPRRLPSDFQHALAAPIVQPVCSRVLRAPRPFDVREPIHECRDGRRENDED